MNGKKKNQFNLFYDFFELQKGQYFQCEIIRIEFSSQIQWQPFAKPKVRESFGLKNCH